MTHPDLDRLLGDVGRVVKAIDPGETRALVRVLAEARIIFVAGVGRSGCVARAFAVSLMQLDLRVHVVGDPTTPPITAQDVLLVCSGSGRTESMVGLAGRAVQAGARLALVTSAIIAPLTQLAHVKVLVPPILPSSGEMTVVGAPPDTTGKNLFQPMRTLFEQASLLCLDYVVLLLAEHRGVSPAQMQSRHGNLE